MSWQLKLLWQQLRVRYPASFKASGQDLLAWHQHEAEACLQAELWKCALGHLDQLVKGGWNVDWVSQRRAQAQTELMGIESLCDAALPVSRSAVARC